MTNHAFTLAAVARELRSLVGAKVTAAYTQEKDFLEIEFYDGAELVTVAVSASGKRPAMFIRKNFSRAAKNSADVLPALLGEVLQSAEASATDRIINLRFINRAGVALLFGRGSSNFLLLDSNRKVIDEFVKKNNSVGKPFAIPQPNAKPIEEFPPETKILDALAKSSLLLGKRYAEEFCLRQNIQPGIPLEDLKPEELGRIIQSAERFRQELINSDEFFVLKDSFGEPVFSATELQSCPEIFRKTESASEAIAIKLSLEFSAESAEELRSRYATPLARTIGKLERALSSEEKNRKLAENIEKYKLYGELLISHPDQRHKGEKSINLNDWSGNELTVQLEPQLTLAQNAGKYFEKSRKAREEAATLERRRPGMERKLEEFRRALKALEEADTGRKLKKIISQNKNVLEKMIRNPKESASPSEKYRRFELEGGYELYVGKNAASNDELTMKFAKANDVWMHARGCPGSHVVLRNPSGEKPPKSVLKQAAEIAAYYSSARNAGYTPVSWTYKKYVRKPKGANPGQVAISKEEVLLVEPNSPATGD
ncbi:MAG: NFACT family protein [Chloroflexota bacterium]